MTTITVMGALLMSFQSGPAQDQPPTASSQPEAAQHAASSPVVTTSRKVVIEPVEYPAQSIVIPEIPAAPKVPRLSPWSAEIKKLVDAGIDDAIIISFVDTAGTFSLTPEQMIYLRDLGVSPAVMNTIIQHDAEILSGARQVIASTVPNAELLLPDETARQASVTSTGSGKGSEAIITPYPEKSAAPNRTPAPGGSERSQPVAELDEPILPQEGTTANISKLFPVREPYPVPLTDPIVVRGEPRIPNAQVLVWFR